MEQLTKNQAVATSQEAVQNQNEPQLRDENAHNDKSVHGVLNPTYQAGLRRDAVQPDRSEERFSRNAETDLVCRLLLEKKNPFSGLYFGSRTDRPSCDAPSSLSRRAARPRRGDSFSAPWRPGP